jgi:ubiquinone/menaquinone biosynthesis C-methylase UbiE/DNA-binding transcriptional ArsR family regulator
MEKPLSGLRFRPLLDGLKAAAEDTRLRLMLLLGEAELTVSELTEILGQSQPRISRHLKLLAEAGLVERHREASWAFYRRASEGAVAALGEALIRLADADDPVLQRDRERLARVRAARAAAAQEYFRKHARQWDEIRRLHVPDAAVEGAIREALGGVRIETLLDLGTGTGRMLELFSPLIGRGLGIDLNPEMLAVARANLDRAGIRNCTVRQGEFHNLALGRDAFDLVILHQVLHYLDDPAHAIREAARVLRPGGRLLIVDFAPHDLEFLRAEHAHRRLGFSEETVAQWLRAAGLELALYRTLAPSNEKSGKLTVSLWLGRDPRMLVAAAARQAV